MFGVPLPPVEIAVAALGATLQFSPVTPGYLPDHIEWERKVFASKRPARPRFAARRTSLCGLLALLSGSCASAHDFWVQPEEFWLQPGVQMPITLQVGHGPLRQRSPLPLHRITRFEAIAPDGTAIDLRGGLHLGSSTADGEIGFNAPGTYVLVLETDDRAQSHLPATRFNDYLESEGLTPALEQRQRTHRTNADGSESYSRRAKAIVQVGPPDGRSQARVTSALGLPLEIVLERSPYAEPRSPTLPVRVIYAGRPLAGALVKLTDLEHDDTPLAQQRTDRAGRTCFAMPRAGRWLLNVIWTRPLPSSRETDFETIFSSLSFGFPPDSGPWRRREPVDGE